MTLSRLDTLHLMGGVRAGAQCGVEDPRSLRSAKPSVRPAQVGDRGSRLLLGVTALRAGRPPTPDMIGVVQSAVGNRGLQRWHAGEPPLDGRAPETKGRVLARKSGLPPDQQAQRYAGQAAQLLLPPSPNHLGAAMLYTRAFSKLKRFDFALQAALGFDTAGDASNAVLWFRRAIETPTGDGDRGDVQRIATEALTRLQRTGTPRYRHTIPVKLDYTLMTKATLTKLNPAWQKQDITSFKRSGRTKEEVSAADVLVQQRATLEKERLAAGSDAVAIAAAEDRFRQALGKLKVVEGDVPGYRVQYLRAVAERQQFQLRGNGGNLLQAGNPYDTTACYSKEAGTGWAIFVMSPDGELYASEHKVGRFHHSSFLAGGDAAAAGEIKVVAGKVRGLTNKSGHYAPSYQHTGQVLAELRDLGQDLSLVELILHVGNKVRWKTAAAGFLAL